MSILDGPAEFAAVALRSCVNQRELDQLMARQDNVQATQPHQRASGGLSFAERDELTAKIGKSEVGLSNVSRSPIVFANLLRTDGGLPRSWQFHVTVSEQPFECLLSNTQNRLDWSAEQFNGDLNQKEDGRNRYQVDIPLHVAPQSSRRFNLEVVDWLCLLRLRPPPARSINPNGALPARSNRSRSFGLCELS